MLWNKLGIIVLAAILCGAIAFSYAVFFVPPMFTSSAMMYVTNNQLAVDSSVITFTSSQISAARSLLGVYVVILKSPDLLELVIEEAGLDMTYSELRGMISADAVNNTEVFSISATCADGKTAKLIVDTIVKILPGELRRIVKASSIEVVNNAREPKAKSSPSYTNYGTAGIIFGVLASVASITFMYFRNNTMRSEEELKRRYNNIPVLAAIPNVNEVSKRGYYSYDYSCRCQKYGDYGN